MFNIPEFLSTRAARKRANEVFDVLISRAPNAMRLQLLRKHLPSLSEEEILAALGDLIKDNRIELHEHPNTHVPGRVIRSYRPLNPTDFPMKESISIGGVEFQRSFHGDMMGAEDMNAFVEAIAEYDSKIETRVSKLALAMTRKYWANIAALFALFISVFALILRASEPLAMEGISEPVEIFLLKSAELAPLAIILFVFVLLFWLVMRKL